MKKPKRVKLQLSDDQIVERLHEVLRLERRRREMQGAIKELEEREGEIPGEIRRLKAEARRGWIWRTPSTLAVEDK